MLLRSSRTCGEFLPNRVCDLLLFTEPDLTLTKDENRLLKLRRYGQSCRILKENEEWGMTLSQEPETKLILSGLQFEIFKK